MTIKSPPELDGLVSGPLPACPECGHQGLRVVTDGEDTNVFCPVCALCWHLELGWVSRVDPATCPGCPHLPECRASGRPYGMLDGT